MVERDDEQREWINEQICSSEGMSLEFSAGFSIYLEKSFWRPKLVSSLENIQGIFFTGPPGLPLKMAEFGR